MYKIILLNLKPNSGFYSSEVLIDVWINCCYFCRHNTVVMMEMQDTINELQRELTALGKAAGQDRPSSEGAGQQVSQFFYHSFIS